MAFPIPLAAKMSGASTSQLRYWHRQGVLVPEVEHSRRPYLYSFRDIYALRTFAWLRNSHSLQQIRKAFVRIHEFEPVHHPSHYVIVKLGKSIGIVRTDGSMVDISAQPGQEVLGTLENVFAEFETRKKKKVDDLLHPRRGVEVNPDRLGGWPTIAGTRIPYDTIAHLVSDGTVMPPQVSRYFPGVTAADATDALDYFRSVYGTVA